MRNKFNYGRLALILAVLLLSMAAAADDSGWKRFACPAGNFSIELPPGFQQLDKVPDALLAAAGAQEGPEDKFIENLTVGTMPNSPPRTIEDFFDLYLRSVSSSFDGYQFVDRGEMKIDGRAGRRLVFFQKLEGERVEVLQVLFIKGEKIFILTYTDSPATFDRRRADFERSAASMKFD